MVNGNGVYTFWFKFHHKTSKTQDPMDFLCFTGFLTGPLGQNSGIVTLNDKTFTSCFFKYFFSNNSHGRPGNVSWVWGWLEYILMKRKLFNYGWCGVQVWKGGEGFGSEERGDWGGGGVLIGMAVINQYPGCKLSWKPTKNSSKIRKIKWEEKR